MGAGASRTSAGVSNALDDKLGADRPAIAYKAQEEALMGVVNGTLMEYNGEGETGKMITALANGGRTENDYAKKKNTSYIPFSYASNRTKNSAATSKGPSQCASASGVRGHGRRGAAAASRSKEVAQSVANVERDRKLTWRERVMNAKRHAQLTLKAVEVLSGGGARLKPHARFLSGLPFQILTCLGEEADRFIMKATELAQHEAELKAAQKQVVDLTTNFQLKVMTRKSFAKGRKGGLPPVRGTKASEMRAQANQPRAPVQETKPQMTRDEKLQAAQEKVDQLTDSLAVKTEDTHGYLRQYCHRTNAVPVLSAEWGHPFLYNVAQWASNDLDGPKHYKNQVKEFLQQGKVCVHLLNWGAELEVEGGNNLPLANTDPWDIVESYSDNADFYLRASHLDGIAMGPRQIVQLITRVRELAGEEAIQKLVVVITIGSTVASGVVADLLDRDFYGMDPNNVIIVEEPWLPGFSWDTNAREFRPFSGQGDCAGAKTLPLGSGYDMQLLSFKGEGYQIGAHGVHIPLETSVLDWLVQTKGCQWMTVNRLTDLWRFTDMVLDADSLALSIQLQKTLGINMTIECKQVDSIADLRRAGYVILRNTGVHGSAALRQVQQIEWDSFNVPAAHDLLTKLMKSKDQQMATSTNRFMCFLPDLVKTLKREEITHLYTPCFKMDEGTTYIRPNFDMADLSEKSKCAGLVGNGRIDTFADLSNIRELVSFISKQEKDEEFIQTINSLPRSVLGTVAMSSAGRQIRMKIMVCCTANVSTRVAFELVQPLLRRQLDQLILVHFVSDMSEFCAGKHLLESLKQADMFVDTRREVILRSSRPDSTLKDDIEDAAEFFDVDLVVIGTNSVGRGNEKLGSMGFRYLVNGITVSTLFVNEAHSTFQTTVDDMDDLNYKGGLAITHDCRQLVDFAARFLRPHNDKLTLYRCMEAGAKSCGSNDLLKARKTQIWSTHAMQCKTKVLEGKARHAFPQAVERDDIDILMLPAPQGLVVSQGMKEIYQNCKCAVLFFKDKPEVTQL